MKLAITGGTGFVGSHLIDAALAAGHEVQALARRDQPERPDLAWRLGRDEQVTDERRRLTELRNFLESLRRVAIRNLH